MSDSSAQNSSGTLAQTLLDATARILRPLVRVLLRNRVACDAVTRLVRRVYVDVAFEEFGLEGKRPTQSRVSVLTGLNRKEVARLLNSRTDAADSAPKDRRNRAAAVLTAWLRDEDFQDAAGQPRPLPFTGPISFTELCKRHSGDMKPRAIADELLASGALVEQDGDLAMTARGYVPGADPEEILRILGADTAELIETIDHNLGSDPAGRRYQSKVLYENVPAEHVAEFLHYSAHRAQALLEDLDRWLAARDAGDEDASKETSVRLGLGTFQIVGDGPPKAPDHDPETNHLS